MIRADYQDKSLVVDLLSRSFDANKSVNYIIKQDSKRAQRLKSLMTYSFKVCYHFGDVFLSDDKKGCALILFPDKKKITFKTILWDIQLFILSVGISDIKKVMDRESKIYKQYPEELMYYLWFIGVDPNEQNKGIGSKMLADVIIESTSINRPIYLETSNQKSIPWYEKFGFRIYNELDLGYTLFLMKRESY